MVSSSLNRGQVFDPVRKRYVSATPEELVRQTLLNQMIEGLGFPKELIAVEKGLPDLKRRVDILCYYKGKEGLLPLLMIECKQGELDGALEQVKGYNSIVRAPFIAVANVKEVRVGFFDQKLGKYEVDSTLPSYRHLVARMEG